MRKITYWLFALAVLGCENTTKPETKADVELRAATSAAVQLQRAMRNPDSFVLEAVRIIPATDAICFQYRSQNGFGGMSRGQAVLAGALLQPGLSGDEVLSSAIFKTSEEPGFTRLWNKECTQAGVDKVDLVKTAMRWAK